MQFGITHTHTHTHTNQHGVAILVSNKTEFKAQGISWDKDAYFMLIKGILPNRAIFVKFYVQMISNIYMCICIDIKML